MALKSQSGWLICIAGTGARYKLKFKLKNDSGFAPLQIRPIPIEFASFVTSLSPDISSIISPLYLIEFAPNISNII